MSTRARRSYQSKHTMSEELQEALKAPIEDREKREEEIVADRATREREIEAERAKRARRLKREKETKERTVDAVQAHMETLKKDCGS